MLERLLVRKVGSPPLSYADYSQISEVHMKKIIREALNTTLIVLGILSAGLGLKGFLLSSHFIDGGVTGISMLLANVLAWPLSILILAINLPFIALGYRQIGRGFAIRSTLAIAGLALCLAFLKYPDVTPDKLLTAVFGGFFIGAGIGLAIRGGAVLDGTEIAALLISKSSHLLKVGDVILLLNVIIFLAAASFWALNRPSIQCLLILQHRKRSTFLFTVSKNTRPSSYCLRRVKRSERRSSAS